jgi:hypothetical protein
MPLLMSGSSGLKWFHTILLVLGAALLAGLVIHIGPAKLWSDARSVGWGLVPIAALSGVEHFLHMLAWRRCFHRQPKPSRWRLLGAPLAGNAISFVTPTATVGGEVARATLMPSDMPRSVAVAALTIDRLTWSLADVVLAITGVTVILIRAPIASGSSGVQAGLIAGVAALTAGVLGFLWMQRGGRAVAFFTENRFVKKLGGARLAERMSRGGSAVDQEIALYHSERTSDLWLSVVLHIVAVSMAALQLAVFLVLIGQPISTGDILCVFVVGAAIDVGSFFVPARLGAQEATRMFALSIVGLGPEIGLLFSLVLRVEQILWAGIGLVVYTCMVPGERRGVGVQPEDGVDPKTCARGGSP